MQEQEVEERRSELQWQQVEGFLPHLPVSLFSQQLPSSQESVEINGNIQYHFKFVLHN